MAPLNDPSDTHGRLIAASKVNGTNVYNRAGEKLGSIYDVMLAKELGKADYAIMSFGGFLGIGEQYPSPPGTSSPTVPSMTAMWLISTATGLKERLPMPPVKRASGMIPPTAATSSTITLGPYRNS